MPQNTFESEECRGIHDFEILCWKDFLLSCAKFSSFKATLHDCSTPEVPTSEWIYVIFWRTALTSAHLDWQTLPTLARKERKKERKRLSLNNLPPLDCKHAWGIQKPTTFLVQTRWDSGSIRWWYGIHILSCNQNTLHEKVETTNHAAMCQQIVLYLGNCPIRLLSARVACRSLPHSHSCKLFNIRYIHQGTLGLQHRHMAWFWHGHETWGPCTPGQSQCLALPFYLLLHLSMYESRAFSSEVTHLQRNSQPQFSVTIW